MTSGCQCSHEHYLSTLRPTPTGACRDIGQDFMSGTPMKGYLTRAIIFSALEIKSLCANTYYIDSRRWIPNQAISIPGASIAPPSSTMGSVSSVGSLFVSTAFSTPVARNRLGPTKNMLQMPRALIPTKNQNSYVAQ